MNILVVEDDWSQAEVIRRYAEASGHTATVCHAGDTALALLGGAPPGSWDLVVLDVMLPGLDGLSVCRQLRAFSDVPVLMLTAKVGEDSLVHGFDVGADDYLTKPYSPRELMVRVRALHRRSAGTPGGKPEDPALRAGPLVADLSRHEARLDGELLDLTPGEFAVLTAFLENPGRVLSRQQVLLLSRGDAFVTERAVDTHVMNLRKKIEKNPRRPELLVSVYGVGYKLVTP